ncbi:MAG TPA: peptidylprolyl isomerase [Chloroflexaceae bacterium]|nr:peptidylprolyl isomerase [Chloroflexaceae bacterium]
MLTITGVAIGLALLAIVGGLLYDRLWVPSRPVARVGSAELSRGAYWDERRNAFAREVVQNFQLLALFGGNPQFTQQFQGQSPVIDRQVEAIRGAPVDPAVVGQWETRQIKEQGAAGLGLSAGDDEINQAMANDLGFIFLPPPAPPVTATAEISPTADPAAPTADPVAEGSPTADPAAPTATPEATATLAPTSTPEPTPAPAEAATQVDQIIAEIFRRYELELAAAAEDPSLSREDFRAALTDQYREQVLNEKIQASLVPAEGFAFATEPERVQARQVLVAVTPPEGATQEQLDAAFAEALPAAEAIAAELRGGADFAAVAAASSDDPGSRENGGDLGSFDASGTADSGVTYPPELVEQAFALEEGAISGPIRTPFGWHIIEVTGRDVPSEEEQLRQARTEALDAWVEEQRAQIGVARFPEPTATPPGEPTAAPIPTPVPTFAPGPPTAEPPPPPAETPATPEEPTPTGTP